MRLVWLVTASVGLAMPAAAGERVVLAEVDAGALLRSDLRLAAARAHADTLALLMADHRVTGGAVAEADLALPVSYDLRAFALSVGIDEAPGPVALNRFEALEGAAPAFVPGGLPIADWRVDASEPLILNGARDVVTDSVVKRNAPFRRKALMSGSVTLHLDGREVSPSLMAGGTAAVLNMVPR